MEINQGDVELDKETVDESEQYKKNLFTLNWLSMRQKQLQIAICYEKYKNAVPVFDQSDSISEKITKLKVELNELKNNKEQDTVVRRHRQFQNMLNSIAASGSTNAKTKKSKFSEEQIKCIRDLMHKKKILQREVSSKEKELVSLEEGLDKEINDLRSKQKCLEDITTGITKEEFKRLDAETQQQVECKKLAHRCQLLAKMMSSLSRYSMAMNLLSEPQQLQPLLEGCQEVMLSQLEDITDIHSLVLKIHGADIHSA